MRSKFFVENKTTRKEKSLEEQSPYRKFRTNLLKNTVLAITTVPAEGMALRRIFYVLEHPKAVPVPYLATLKTIGPKGLFSGPLSRSAYCLTGNFATLQGIHYFGSDYKGMFLTTLFKNSIIPVFLISNARQTGLNFSQTLSYVNTNIKYPVVHASFFFRNLVANSCLPPGFFVRNYSYQALGESNTTIPTLLGFGTSVFASTIINAFLKPFFTGAYPLSNRYMAAWQFPGIIPLLFRESASLGLIFGNTSPQKKGAALDREVDADCEENSPPAPVIK
ncbi:hypothetical protein [Legionella spiritensis]|uniref:Uncharacterized protein n=1 Tax=Legionella spiritensis TaxID=452 RepID=A0A0W0Z5Z2_LEGSP|nr:hypothetical protein [Legionella spiritensis]KTD64546.1 hypothetical protein Lspi_1353 [Legionella spiritensis]SNV29838.1 Uncharacterised protein [Legionella spiritensis]